MNIIKRYYNKLLRYLRKLKLVIKEYIYLIKYRFKYPKTKLMQNIKFFFQEIIKPEHRKALIAFSSMFFVIMLFLVISFSSFAFYNDTATFPMIRSKVGNIYYDKYDNSLLVYVENYGEDGDGDGTYRISEYIPHIGYTYSGYTCENNSILEYDEVTKTATYTTDKKEVCSIYFDITARIDESINIMLETEVDSGNYIITNDIPYFGYQYSNFECTNNKEIIYDAINHKITYETDSIDNCNIYFNKINTNSKVNLYIEKEPNNYIKSNSIPMDITYTLKESDSYCENINKERIDGIISYNNGMIEINSQDKLTCNVYLDKND